MNEFSDLVGKTLVNIEIISEDHVSEEIIFTIENGKKYKLFHNQGCCEVVNIEDIIGDINDLVGSPILMAEEISEENENPEGVPVPDYQDSFTWTFYKLATIKGYVTIRWYGESNGYYSERVEFCEA